MAGKRNENKTNAGFAEFQTNFPQEVSSDNMFTRMYHVSSAVHSFKKQAIKLNKLLNPKEKRQWYLSNAETAAMPSLKSLTKVKYEPGKRGVRRLAMLNKLFMKNITDLMSTGTVAMGVLGRGIEVSKVKVSPDFQTVTVFWVCKGDASDAETDAILNRTAGALRHELSTLRVMGEVPYIVFAKDKQESQLVDLDRRLAIADYGEDYTPTEMGHLLKTEFTLDTKLSPEMKAKIKQLEEDIDIVEEPLPEMTHTVYGLDHSKIMNRLLAARKKSRDAWSNLNVQTSVISYRMSDVQSTEEGCGGSERKELAAFLKKRQILQGNLHKQKRSGGEDWHLLEDTDIESTPEDIDEDVEEDDDYEYESGDNFYRDSPGRLQLDSKPDNR